MPHVLVCITFSSWLSESASLPMKSISVRRSFLPSTTSKFTPTEPSPIGSSTYFTLAR